MNKVFISELVLILSLVTACGGQKAELLKDPETRLYMNFEEQKDDLFVENIDEFNSDDLKAFYEKNANFTITESELRKSIQIQSNDDAIITFSPVVDSIVVNNSYIVILHKNYISAISSNPTRYVIPTSFNLDRIISIEKQKNINERILISLESKGEAEIMKTNLYFDCQESGKLVYTVKVDVNTNDYSYGEVFVFDGFSGEIID